MYTLSHKKEKEGTPNSLYEASLTLILKPKKKIVQRKKTTDQCPLGM